MPRAGSNFIRQRREELRLTQLALALEAGVSVRTVQLAESGDDRNSSNRTLRAIAEILGVDYEKVLYVEGGADGIGDSSDSERDAFQAWPWSLSDFIAGRAAPEPHAVCRSIGDAKFAIRSMRESWSKHLDRCDGYAADDGFARADEKLSREYEQYENRYLRIWQANPNAVLFSTVEQERSGVCVVLPVTKKAYESIRQGSLSFMKIEAADILPESQHLILDSAVEIPCASSPQFYQVTNSLSFALFYQIALLSENPVASSFRMVGFGASPINLERLGGIGFSPCGVKMPDYGFQVCEFTLESDEQTEDAFKRSLTTLHYANLFKIFSLTSASLNEKRMMIRKALRLYQRTAKTHANSLVRDQDSSVA